MALIKVQKRCYQVNKIEMKNVIKEGCSTENTEQIGDFVMNVF